MSSKACVWQKSTGGIEAKCNIHGVLLGLNSFEFKVVWQPAPDHPTSIFCFHNDTGHFHDNPDNFPQQPCPFPQRPWTFP